jgi:anti-sigma B factor antagonist
VDLSFSTRERQGVWILDLKGSITLGNDCTRLHQEIQALLAQKHLQILLNLGEVARVDSSGIGTLVESVILTAQAGGRLKLLKIPRLLHNSLVIHRLLEAFEIYPDEEAAVASFQAAAPAGS